MIKVRGNFRFVYKVPTFREIPCILKTGEQVKANFNNLEIDSPGNIWIAVEEEKERRCKGGSKEFYTKNYFVKISQILPKEQKDEPYFIWISKKIKKISLYRKNALTIEKEKISKKKNENKKS